MIDLQYEYVQLTLITHADIAVIDIHSASAERSDSGGQKPPRNTMSGCTDDCIVRDCTLALT